MLGNPKFKREQMVTFSFENNGETISHDGVIYIVDANGTFDQTDEPSYDIEVLLDGQVVLFKHVPESQVTERSV